MSYLEELLPEFRKGAKIRRENWNKASFIEKDLAEKGWLTTSDCLADDWELYQEPVNWEYIIKNKCLCWFWDEGELPVISKLVCFDSSSEYKFTDERNHDWENCRPVRRDEVTFYEDQKDE